MTLPPTEYGWTIENEKYTPVGMKEPVAPEQLLKLTVCNCTSKSNCSSNKCSCKSMGMRCIQACGNCNGLDCENAEPSDMENIELEPSEMENDN